MPALMPAIKELRAFPCAILSPGSHNARWLSEHWSPEGCLRLAVVSHGTFFFRPATACRLSIYFVLFPPHRISEVNKKRWPLIWNTLGMNLLNNYSYQNSHETWTSPWNQRDIHVSNHSNPPLLVSIIWLFFLEYVLLVGTFYFFRFFGKRRCAAQKLRNRWVGTVEEGWRVALWPRQVTANSQGNLDEKSYIKWIF